MFAHGRRTLLLAAMLLVPNAAAQTTPVQPMQEDAWLRDVFFLDPLRGWAVGDRGVIWHTADGGRRWQLQPSGVEAALHSVFFLDDKTGWAVGGTTEPLTHTTRGVLLITRDGGRNWREVPGLLLPALKCVKFFNAAQGWAIGEGSSLHASGVFVTTNGGRRWAPLTGVPGAPQDNASKVAYNEQGWLTGDLVDPNSGALAGRHGRVATVRQREIRPSRTPPFGLRGLRRMQLSRDGRGWLVGDGGLVLTTADLGLSWQLPHGALPGKTREFFDFHAVAVHGPHCWVAGSPGTAVLHSPDGGRSWGVLPTGQNAPIHALHFVDPQHGWAAGALGTILVTADGGRTWHVQRRGGTRAGVLGFFGDPESMPLEWFAQLCGNDGYLGIAEVLCRRDIDQGPRARRTEPQRLHEALVAVGASGAEMAWRFPVRQSGLVARGEQLLEGWDRAADGRGLVRLREHLVRQIRCWRPEVVLTHAAAAQGGDPLPHLINQVVLQAVEAAGDPQQYTDLVNEAGLQPWKVKKVFGRLPRDRFGDVSLDTGQFAPRLGRSPAEAAVPARALLAEQVASSSGTIGFRLSLNTLPQEIGRRGFFTGITLHPGGEARRELRATTDLEALRRSAQKHRNVRAILKQAENNRSATAALIGQLGDLTKDLTGDAAGQMLFELGRRYHDTGQVELAAESFDLLVKRHPQHALATPALVWLVQYWSSGEVAWRLQRGQRVTVQPASTTVDRRDPEDQGSVLPAGGPVPPPRVNGLVTDGTGREDRPRRASEIGKHIERTNPALYAEPRVRFPLAVAHIRQGYPRQAERYYLSQVRGAGGAWPRLAAGEAWLKHRQGPPPLVAAGCVRTPVKPYLDGKLDDALWRAAKPLPLHSRVDDDKTWRAFAKIAYDQGYLYLAANCQRATAAEYTTAAGPRPRDADLTRRDRVEFLIDVDRDYATYYRLVVDHRGWTAEGCWGDETWNPEWFVAATDDGRSWTIEAAIPLQALAGTTPTSKTAWAIGIQRVVPGVGFQSWTTPASTAIQPEGFGYLLFD